MKLPIFFSTFCLATACLAQSTSPAAEFTAPAQDWVVSKTDPMIVEAGPHHRVWSWTNQIQGLDGQEREETHGYTELADGLNYWNADQGAWVPSEENIELRADGAAALKGPCQVTFAADLHTLGAITVQLPDGRRLVSHPLGLTYFDPASGQRVLLAGVRQCRGELHPPNQVVYPDAFEPTNGIRADFRYKYTRSSISQDVVLQSPLPDPRELNEAMDPDGTLLEIWTEFLEAPVPASRPALDTGMDSETFDFGSVHIGAGQAFPLPRDALGPALPIQKRWLQQDGRQFLIESVPYRAIQKNLELLPQAALPKKQGAARAARPASGDTFLTRLFPLPPPKPTAPKAPMRMAALPPPDKGFVLDYIVTLNASTNNVTFASDTTYYLSGTCTLGGSNTIFEGGTVIKYTNGALLCLQSTNVDFQGSQFHPVAFTARDDNTLGETITGSTGNPTNIYANPALRLITGGTNVLQNLRIRYATTGLELSGTNNTISHLQLLKVQTGLKAYGTNPVQVALRNVLAAEINEFLSGTNLTAAVEHLTLAKANYLRASGATPTVCLTNTLLVAVTNTGGYSGASTQEVSSITGVFQTVGAGQYYLATNSPYRDCGTTNINAQLRADLAQRTTYPPTVVSNVTYTANTTLGPTVARHLGTPPLGYAYDPLDYTIRAVTINGPATVLLTNGACLGMDCTGGSYYAISFASTNGSVSFLSQGSALALNHIVHLHSVQEQPASASSSYFFYDGSAPVPYVALRLRYTELAQMAGGYSYGPSGYNLNSLELTHARLRGGSLSLSGGPLSYYPPACGWTNTLFERSSVAITLYSSRFLSLTMRNALLWRGSLGTSVPYMSTSNLNSSIQNNLFDNASLYALGTTNSYNGYINTSVLSGSSGNNVTNATFAYDLGPLGRYYQPTNSAFLNAGSTSATNLGLYHFTTTSNQVKEGTSTVDIGLHYVAVDANGQSLDTDGDGIPDYLEDANGNGITESGETSWDDATDLGLWVRIRRPAPGSPIP